METDVEKYNPLIAETLFRLSRMQNIIKFSWDGVLGNSSYRVKDGYNQICPSIYTNLFELFYEQITLLDLDGPEISNSLSETDLVLIFFSYYEDSSIAEVTFSDNMIYELHFSNSGECTHNFFYHDDEEDEDEEFY
ncbi:hypothetical protein [Enterococcus sp. DIV1059_2]|uniref:hypothetical protein n=1 Tax=Enterococcus sp. DIV1059_2 TaxID=2774664 RepID=UPI003F29B89E